MKLAEEVLNLLINEDNPHLSTKQFWLHDWERHMEDSEN
jgi:hypothetical protein